MAGLPVKVLLGDDPRVAEPPPVGSDTPCGSSDLLSTHSVAHHERSADDLKHTTQKSSGSEALGHKNAL